MRLGLLSLCMLVLSQSALAAEPPAQVLLVGVFHFQDPGKDLVQVDDINIFEENNQQYLEALTNRLAAWAPTVVLLEFSPEREGLMNERYQAYRDGAYELPANEVYQLGFRTAAKAGLARVYGFDHREVPWNIQPVMDMSQQDPLPEVVAFNNFIDAYQREETKARSTLGLPKLLERQNDPLMDQRNMSSYLLTNVVGAGAGWEGADATASWWQRNFRMYALLQKHAMPGARVLAIAGSGHTAILKHLVSLDTDRELVDARRFITEP